MFQGKKTCENLAEPGKSRNFALGKQQKTLYL